MARRCRAVACFLLSVLALAFGPLLHAQAVACAPYIYPCACGLCPRVVNCAELQHKAECFCGERPPGAYAAPPSPQTNANATTTTNATVAQQADPARFFMCGERAGGIKIGVEMRCPYTTIFNSTQRACV